MKCFCFVLNYFLNNNFRPPFKEHALKQICLDVWFFYYCPFWLIYLCVHHLIKMCPRKEEQVHQTFLLKCSVFYYKYTVYLRLNKCHGRIRHPHPPPPKPIANLDLSTSYPVDPERYVSKGIIQCIQQ